MTALRRSTKCTPAKAQLTAVYVAMVARGEVPPSPSLRALLVKKQSKSQSGVLVRRQQPSRARGSALPRRSSPIRVASTR